jgi:hypothetical protein
VGRIDLHFVLNDTLCSHLTVPITSFPVERFQNTITNYQRQPLRSLPERTRAQPKGAATKVVDTLIWNQPAGSCVFRPSFRSWGQRSLRSSSTEDVDFSATTDCFKNLQAVHSRFIIEHNKICRSTGLQFSIVVRSALDTARVPRTKWNSFP